MGANCATPQAVKGLCASGAGDRRLLKRLSDNGFSPTATINSSVQSVLWAVKPPKCPKPYRCLKTRRQTAAKGRNVRPFLFRHCALCVSACDVECIVPTLLAQRLQQRARELSRIGDKVRQSGRVVHAWSDR